MFDLEVCQPARFVKFNSLDTSGKFFSLICRVYLAKNADPDGMVHVNYEGFCGGYPGESFLLKLSDSLQEASDKPGVCIPHRLREILLESNLIK